MQDDPAAPGQRPALSAVPRRQALGALAAGAGALVAGAAGRGAAASQRAAAVPVTGLPAPSEAGIDHVVVLMMENRSFDHYLGWLPRSDGRQAGLKYPGPDGVLHSTYHLTTYQGCGSDDPDHSYQGGRIELNGGKCDGWLLDPANDTFGVGYYEASDLAFYGHAAPYWTTCDRYFAATMGPTYPNRLYMHAAQTDRIDDSTTVSTLPTIWDCLATAGVSHGYYFSDIPFTALWGTKYASGMPQTPRQSSARMCSSNDRPAAQPPAGHDAPPRLSRRRFLAAAGGATVLAPLGRQAPAGAVAASGHVTTPAGRPVGSAPKTLGRTALRLPGSLPEPALPAATDTLPRHRPHRDLDAREPLLRQFRRHARPGRWPDSAGRRLHDRI